MSQETVASPVTIVISRVVARGREAEYEEWLRGLMAVAADFPGYLGADVIKPADHVHPEYVIVVRFADYTSLRTWEQSPQRAEWLEKSRPLAVSDQRETTVDGHEYWFTAPAAPRPARSRQALVTWIGIFPLISLLLWVGGPYIATWPLVLRTLVISVTLVGLMTYVLMPRLTKWFAKFLFPRHQ
jgi:antibiotic biosynthesis monooxygenase (ABM) superfamily enzyme